MELVKYQEKPLQVYRRSILERPEVIQALSKPEQKMMHYGIANEHSGSKIIADIEQNELSQLIKAQVPLIVRDLGIKNAQIGSYEMIRIQSILNDYYADLTFREFALAFEFMITGKLNDFLPKKNGVADNEHYQSFGLNYITKVLNAFKAKKNKTWQKILAIQEPQSEVSQEEKNEALEGMKEIIISKYEEMKAGAEFSEFIVVDPIFDLLRAKNDLTFQVTNADLTLARSRAIKGKAMILQVGILSQPKTYEGRAMRIAKNNAIRDLFRSWIIDDIDISEKL